MIPASVADAAKPMVGPTISVGVRSSPDFTVDDLCRAHALAIVLNEPGMARKLEAELRTIYATHNAIKAAMRPAASKDTE